MVGFDKNGENGWLKHVFFFGFLGVFLGHFDKGVIKSRPVFFDKMVKHWCVLLFRLREGDEVDEHPKLSGGWMQSKGSFLNITSTYIYT